MIGAKISETGFDANLGALKDEIRSALLNATIDMAMRLQASIQDGLSGPILETRTGRLRDSIQVSIDQSSPANPRAVLSSDVPYAAFQNYGFSGAEQVREQIQHRSVAFGRPMTPRDVLVQAYQRQVDYPGRAFFDMPFAAMSGDVAATYRDAVMGAIES
jgi:phage gpG-like protein